MNGRTAKLLRKTAGVGQRAGAEERYAKAKRYWKTLSHVHRGLARALMKGQQS